VRRKGGPRLDESEREGSLLGHFRLFEMSGRIISYDGEGTTEFERGGIILEGGVFVQVFGEGGNKKRTRGVKEPR